MGSTKRAKLVKYLLDKCPVPHTTQEKVYPGTELLEPTAMALARELRQHKGGCRELQKKVGVIVDLQLHLAFNVA